MNDVAIEQTVESPCNQICKIDAAKGVCTGCARTLDEITEWGSASVERQQEILALLPVRIAHAR